MRLKTLTLSNFKGIRQLNINPDCKSLNIYGANGSGKTTVMDAFYWLLFGKDAEGHADFEIKPVVNGEPLHKVENSVEAIFENGLKMKRIYREVWTKKRGGNKEEFTGHETVYVLDNIPVSKKEYEVQVASLAPIYVFMLITDPYQFTRKLKWQERRKILFELCTGVSVEDVIKTNPKLKELEKILDGKDIDKYKGYIKGEVKRINEQLKEIPTRIDELERSKPDVTGNIEEYQQQAKELNAERERLLDERNMFLNGGKAILIKREITELEEALQKVQVHERQKYLDSKFELEKHIRDIESIINDGEHQLAKLQTLIEEKKNLRDVKDKLVKEYRTVYVEYYNEAQPEFPESTTCFACGQELPFEKVQENLKQALEKFKLSKAQRLEEIQAKGKKTKQEVEELSDEISKYILAADAIRETLKAKEKELKPLNRTLSSVLRCQETETETAIKQQIETLHQTLQIEKNNTSTQGIDQKLLHNASQSTQVMGKIYSLQNLSSIQKRINELIEQEKTLSAEYEELMRLLDLAENYTKTQSDLIEQKVNGMFKIARFKLFEQQINGGIADTCEIVMDGVPFDNINHAMQLNIGLDIINTLSAHYGYTMPVFIDNRESVTEIIPVNAQIINLYVSPEHEQLCAIKEGE